jgi:hypothetical protein
VRRQRYPFGACSTPIGSDYLSRNRLAASNDRFGANAETQTFRYAPR